MRRSRLAVRRQRSDSDDGLIPLVNVVFLLMLFFVIAGEIAPKESRVTVPETTRSLEAAAVAPELLVDSDGNATTREGRPVEPEAVGEGPLTLRVDREADAAMVVALARRLEEAGAGPLYMVLEGR